MSVLETKQEIKSRLIKEAARAWGYRSRSDIDLNAFDPLVDLLLGACAQEFEKVSHEITISRKRIFDRMLEVLTPEAKTGPQPAHGIVRARPAEATHITTPLEQLLYKGTPLDQDVFFSPTGRFKLFDGAVQCLAYGSQITRVENYFERESIVEAGYGARLEPNTLWIGLDLNPAIHSLEDLSFYFDWKNNPDKPDYLKFLPAATWWIGEEKLQVQPGLQLQRPENQTPDQRSIYDSLNLEYVSREQINAIYHHAFLTVKGFAEDRIAAQNLQDYKSPVPEPFKNCFPERDLNLLRTPLLWIKVQFPESLPVAFEDMECWINCFPVCNRRLQDQQERIRQSVNIIPLKVSHHFFDIHRITSGEGKTYEPVAFQKFDQKEEGVFALRKGGVKRFDQRDASGTLDHVLDLIREESAAFQALANNTLSSELKELDQVFTRIRKNVKLEMQPGSEVFLFFKPFRTDDNIYISYWSTAGRKANDIPYRTALESYSGANLKRGSIFLASTTRGGRDPLRASESLYAFKEALMTRGRIVTPEDIKAFTFNHLGANMVRDIKIEKGLKLDKRIAKGLVRTIDVFLTPRNIQQPTREAWQELCHDTEVMLNKLSAGHLPIRVLVRTAEPITA